MRRYKENAPILFLFCILLAGLDLVIIKLQDVMFIKNTLKKGMKFNLI